MASIEPHYGLECVSAKTRIALVNRRLDEPRLCGFATLQLARGR